MKDPAPSDSHPSESLYAVLCDKVDDFARKAMDSRPEAFSCKAGCASCCQAGLTVSAIEATRVSEGIAGLSSEHRERLLQRADDAEAEGRCVMLDDLGECTIYPFRPLVCRSQGLALAYPANVVPTEAIFSKLKDGRDVTWCPLNYQESSPDAAHILDAQQIDTVLATTNRQFVGTSEENSVLSRISLVALLEKA